MCLDFQEVLLNSTWGMLNDEMKIDLENQLDCCGLLNVTSSRSQFERDMQNCTAVSCLSLNDAVS